jgi:V/A-type H+/Na+-transporting ATPase subunit E
MADSRLQELIETLKKQAVESGEASSRQIIEGARKEAKAIVDRARAEGDEITRKAQEEADTKLKQLESSMEIAGSQFVTSLKRVIEQNLLALPLKEKVTEALGDTAYLKEIIRTVVLEYAQHPEKSDLQVLVSENQRGKLVDLMVELVKARGEGRAPDHKGLTLHAGNVEFGFMINKREGNVTLDFTDEAFLALFLKFLTPRFREFFKDIKLGAAAGK